MQEMFKFNDEVHAYQSFVRKNIKSLGQLTIISEQLLIKDIEKGFIDVLTLDTLSKQIVVLELKNVSAGDDIIGQSIKYFDFLMRAKDDLLDLLAKMKNQLDFTIEEINLTPKIMLIVPEFSTQLLRSLSYVNEIEIQVIKLNCIQHDNHYEIIKELYIPNQDYREDAAVEINGEPTKSWNFNEYYKEGVDREKLDLAKQIIRFANRTLEVQGKKLDVFFYKDKITLMIGKKVIGNIKISRKWFDSSVDLSLSINKDKPIEAPDLMYDVNIAKYDIGIRKVKLKCNSLPAEILNKIL